MIVSIVMSSVSVLDGATSYPLSNFHNTSCFQTISDVLYVNYWYGIILYGIDARVLCLDVHTQKTKPGPTHKKHYSTW